MATTITLNAIPREDRGKGAARKIRASAFIPAVLYGRGSEPVLLKVPTREFLRTVTGHSVSNMILDVKVEGADAVKALIREIQTDPLTNEVLHLDLNRISMTERLEIEIPLQLEGTPVGVKDFGGVLSHPSRTVRVSCLPLDVPENIVVDISGMQLGDVLHARDIAREGLTILDPDEVVASVSIPAAMESAAAEAAVESGAAEPEVIGQKKAEEGGES